jgi:hypothetical protein
MEHDAEPQGDIRTTVTPREALMLTLHQKVSIIPQAIRDVTRISRATTQERADLRALMRDVTTRLAALDFVEEVSRSNAASALDRAEELVNACAAVDARIYEIRQRSVLPFYIYGPLTGGSQVYRRAMDALRAGAEVPNPLMMFFEVRGFWC